MPKEDDSTLIKEGEPVPETEPLSENFVIKFVGLEKTKLKPYQKYNLKKIAHQEALKIERGIKNEFTITIHIKEYEKDGNRQKYSVNMKLAYPGYILNSDKGKDASWDIETALRKSFNNAKNKINTRFHADTSWKKPYQ